MTQHNIDGKFTPVEVNTWSPLLGVTIILADVCSLHWDVTVPEHFFSDISDTLPWASVVRVLCFLLVVVVTGEIWM